ncbi:MAG: aquaporin [Pseudomonadota bacterium]
MTGPLLKQKLLAEWLGTALLLAVVIGSGVMGERLAGGNTAIALLANALATGAALFVLITLLAPVSGAHFNPAVTLVFALRREIDGRTAMAYGVVQVAGAFAGVACAHLMFGLPLFAAAQHERAGWSQAFSEAVATFGLVLTILLVLRHAREKIPALVACWIVSAYWFTASTSFANPAVTLARAASDTFAGIRPVDVPPFLVAQLAGALLATGLARFMAPATTGRAS